MHAHRCKKCATVFYHSNEMRGSANAHKCPVCGNAEWEQFAPENAKLPNFNGSEQFAAHVHGNPLSQTVIDALNIVSAVLLCAAAGLIFYKALAQLRAA